MEKEQIDQHHSHPAFRYMQAVAKKASDEGWKLKIARDGFAWKNANGKVFQEQWNSLGIGDLVHQACVSLERRENWNLEIVL